MQKPADRNKSDTDVPAMNKIVSREEWLEARLALLEREKALTRARDAVAAERRALPWVAVDKPYAFDTVAGPASLAGLFAGRRQLVMQHFMFAPGWTEGCVGCSFMADHIDAMLPHLAARDVAFVACSRAPLADLLAFRRRMGWRFDWVSSHGSDFNHDFGVSFRPEELAAGTARYNYRPMTDGGTEQSGFSAFCRDEGGRVLHSYSSFSRGDEMLMGTYMMLDIAPLGRNEAGLAYPQAWWRHHDRYEGAGAGCCAGAG